jgi:hypothetical protein
MKRRARYMIRCFQKSSDGRQMIALGVRFGYWPCLRAPFIQIAIWKWRCEFWYGFESYKGA